MIKKIAHDNWNGHGLHPSDSEGRSKSAIRHLKSEICKPKSKIFYPPTLRKVFDFADVIKGLRPSLPTINSANRL